MNDVDTTRWGLLHASYPAQVVDYDTEADARAELYELDAEGGTAALMRTNPDGDWIPA